MSILRTTQLLGWHADYMLLRRAKAKLQDGKQRPAKIVEVPPESPPHLSKGFQVDLHNLIHEDERKQFICQRIASNSTMTDAIP